ncbi:hypothetical protein CHU92_11750 [Flavobacterium cyanobacteriorum]|uniref:DUF4349 domain-containing protein n=1 Tax=Flavobacterium cyanobacteriorum TaxID=2022802 RepID=A0A255YZ06_9FLAO|nr:DUF4349 domain-containing protein [Flavobacterium cyanobacteriorum]OYQ34419.1 hypothetical protein CHU92_11750 [Flavobacterium cyanobacteriorum]
MKQTIILLVLMVQLTACKKEEEAGVGSTDAVMAMEAVAANEPVVATDSTGGRLFSVQKIIKNADLRFETTDMAATSAEIHAAVKKYGAQLQQDSESKNDYSVSRNMIIRVPSASFDPFLATIGRGVAYFERKEISSQDVTEEYIDVEARMKAKKVLEARYLELISKAKKVSEILEIEKELSAIREEIEVKEGQLRYMKNRVALSTVTIEFYKTTEKSGGATVSYISKMWAAIKSGFNTLSGFFISLLYMWPFILIFVIAYLLIRRKLRKRMKNDKTI